MREDPEIRWNISWIGPKVALSGTTLKPFELELFPKLNVSVYSITAGKLQSKFTRHTIPSLLKIPLGFWQSIINLRKIRPDVVLSFGGYAAVPVVAAAYVMRIPIVLHEQTVAAGLANRVTGLLATKIALARAESIQFFPKQKCIVVGNPLTQEVLSVKNASSLPQRPIIYVTGGSRGAQRVNNPVFESLNALLPKYKIIHQTGQLDYAHALLLKKQLPTTLQKNYEVHAFINPLEIGNVYKEASLVIGRAGANTVSEVMTLAIPSIFIPIPWTRLDEQTKNARSAELVGVSTLLPESKLNSQSLVSCVHDVFTHWKKMKLSGDDYQKINKDRSASESLRTVVSKVLS